MIYVIDGKQRIQLEVGEYAITDCNIKKSGLYTYFIND